MVNLSVTLSSLDNDSRPFGSKTVQMVFPHKKGDSKSPVTAN